ncbi:MAG: ROK family protein [Leifsonia sp.]
MRLGIDIGGTKTAAIAMDSDGRLSEQVRMPTGFGGGAVIETAVDAVRQVVALSGIPIEQLRSIGIGIPGAVDSATGRVSHAVNLGVEDLELGRTLIERLGVSVRVENDVKAAAIGAHHLLTETGTADGFDSMAYLNLGTGLAAGIVQGGRLLRGGHGIAGEIGHIPVDPNGALCSCGQFGCVETIASGSAIARMWPTEDPLPARALFEAAASGDPAALAVQQRFFDGVSAAVRILVLTTDVDAVVIGGGLSSLGTPLLSGVCAALERAAASSPFLASLDLTERVHIIPLGFPAAAVGAALTGVAHG